LYESHFELIPKATKQNLLEMAKIIKPVFDAGDIGLIYLDKEDLLKIFAPYIKRLFGMEKRFARCWLHWMKDGGSRPRHQHSAWTYLYYLDIPEGDAGSLQVDGKTIPPVEGTHIMFPNKTYHSITPNKTKQTRWAFAAECVPI